MERKWWTLLLSSLATFMLLLDITVVNVALPDIQRDLDASLSSLQWVVDAYSLLLAVFLLTAGSLGDRLGRRRVFSLGLVIFTFASFLCGIAGDPTLLNLARGLQGVGGAAMFATSLALIGQEFHGRDRATAFGVWGATVGGAVAIGPLVGGLITEHLGWQWIFFVNIPIGVLAVALTELRLVNVAAQDPQRIDLPGLATFSGGLFLLIFGLIRGNPEGWGSATIVASLAGSAALLLAFFAVEARSGHPMLDLALFRKPAFNGVSAVAFGLSARPRSPSSQPPKRGWARGSTRPSARSGSRPASPRSAPSSSPRSTRSSPPWRRTRRPAWPKRSPRAARTPSPPRRRPPSAPSSSTPPKSPSSAASTRSS